MTNELENIMAEVNEENVETVQAVQIPYAQKYKSGKQWIAENLSIHLVPDATCKETCFHRLQIRTAPLPEHGITYPAGFTCSRPITPEEFDNAQTAWQEAISDKEANPLDEQAVDFWTPLFMPKSLNASSELDVYTMQKLQLKAIHEAQYGGATHDVGIAINPSKCVPRGLSPEAYIPETNWFDSKLTKEVKIKDVLTLFNGPEQELLAICFGRAVVGRPNHVPVGEDKALKHAFRTFPVIFGAEPGQGKSVFANALISAVKSVGYRVANFKTMASRFNLGGVVTAHIALIV